VNLGVETEIDLVDLMDQVFHEVDRSVVLDLILDNLEETVSHDGTWDAGGFEGKCHQLIKQIEVRLMLNPPDEQGDSEEAEG
tara:strand:- start:241 stop:486 length:246 start_codon:yes stop_codon:yes gene_type:complete